MKLPPFVEKQVARFDQLSLRERALIAGALVAALVIAWDAAMMQPLHKREQGARAELQSIEAAAEALTASTSVEPVDPTSQALEQERSLRAALDAVDVELASASAGLIAPERMVDVIHDVLSRQRGVRLVSMRNQPVSSLAAPSDESLNPQGAATGPYVHPIELTIEGGYLAVLAYLQALETLPWSFYWKVIEIETREHPTSRARIEISTLSMEKEWLGV